MPSEPATEEGMVGEETWDAGDRVATGYETSKAPQVGSEYCMAYFVLHLIDGGRQIIPQIASKWKFQNFGISCRLRRRLPLLTSSVGL